MSNVQECIELYLEDDKVSDPWFRAMLRHAHEQDAGEPTDNGALLRLARVVEAISDQVEVQGKSLVLLNRVDDVRRDQIAATDKEVSRLYGFLDGQAGAVRVLRERLDNMEGK